MGNKMLIDATHPEETRVVVTKGSRVEEFDFEAASARPLRGNIYLAKVTRVEPSLQAAFVNFGGNRHGFLAFNEIHTDYYQIPVADRLALQAEEAEERARADSERPAREPRAPRPARSEDSSEGSDASDDADADAEDDDAEDDAPEEIQQEAASFPEGDDDEDDDGDEDEEDDSPASARSLAVAASPSPAIADAPVEVIEDPDALEEVPQRVAPRRRRRSYKIQEVIKRGQVILVQVVKEERGTKGAALTTYLSLAGRYTVLMPNTATGGGISRKIGPGGDRKRLKDIVGELDVPDGMGLIVRTAGAARTKAEIKRDFEYLLRLWESVRDLTLQSSAPALVYEEGDLIKRSLRDLYSKEIDEIVVAGEDGYREAQDFMRMLMPSHAGNIEFYQDTEPLFARHGVEPQLSALFSPQVTLKSGGYIVINQTEALVAIDVNSGKATREHSIEDTAYKTNLEAADEVARQLRLRDLAGLIVIDFIDMDENRNNRNVERRIKDALRMDRARIQIGRISHFGLLEMSRQRMRTGMVEKSTRVCPTCNGTGVIRSVESVALAVLRAVENQLMTGGPSHLAARCSVEAAIYILNHKRSYVLDIEARYGVTISVFADEELAGDAHIIEKVAGAPLAAPRPRPHVVHMDWDKEMAGAEDAGEPVETIIAEAPEEGLERTIHADDGERTGRRRRRRGGRGRNGGERLNGAGVAEAGSEVPHAEDDDAETDEADAGAPVVAGEAAGPSEDRPRRGRRRGRRGGRGRNGREGELPADARADDAASTNDDNYQDDTIETAEPVTSVVIAAPKPQLEAEEDAIEAPPAQAASRPPRRPRTRAAAPAEMPVSSDMREIPADTTVAEPAPRPRPAAPPTAIPAQPDDDAPRRGGWWQRRFGV